MPKLSTTIDDREVREALTGMARRGRDLGPVFRTVDRFVGDEFRQQFESRGAHGGEPWKELAPATKKHRQNRRSNPGGNRGGVDHPLWNTGALKNSLVEVGGNSIRSIGKDEYIRGTRLARGFYHQVGAGVPQRRIITEKMLERMGDKTVAVAAEYIFEADLEAGGLL